MAQMPKRNSNIVVKSQFNINGSRGKDVGSFVSDYVAREDGADVSMAYLPPTNRPIEAGDGIAFTLDRTAISKKETLELADKVQNFHDKGNRAIEQIVISFSPEYLVQQGIVPEGEQILRRGDYQYNYDDIRLRHAVSSGIHSMIENEGYHDGRMVAAIQSDTLHLHAHAVVYENFPEVGRKYGSEERGMLRESSLQRLSFNIDRSLEDTKNLSVVPTQRLLTPETLDRPEVSVVSDIEVEEPEFVNHYLRILEEQEREKALKNKVEKLDKEDVQKVESPSQKIEGEEKQI